MRPLLLLAFAALLTANLFWPGRPVVVVLDVLAVAVLVVAAAVLADAALADQRAPTPARWRTECGVFRGLGCDCCDQPRRES